MPTGVHLRDARQQLFDAAERVLLRTGPNGLTSRAVTDEAACSKGVLHRHFADFDTFLAELVLDRAAQVEAEARALREAVGTATVTDNLTGALTTLFGPVVVAIIPLITFRDELRARLRQALPGDGAGSGGGGVAILSHVTAAVCDYLTEERAAGRIAADADVDSLTLSLVGGAHLLFADRDPGPPTEATVGKLVTTALADVLRRRPS
ncbi:TetR/AcrR family transcriptional regulator [Streptomyces sp. NPDC016845]|uniref:TetR/AcrR family transcriptional regulator n=1 Tax=Streptomyces sp. NPDC016845 TaxID=3364972 RepID=UPI0037A528B0